MKNDKFADYNYKGEERFFPMKNGDILWVYFNEQETQWVVNVIDENILKKAMENIYFGDLEKQECIDEIFDFIQSSCRQYCVDWWDDEFENYVKAMEKEKRCCIFIEGKTEKTLNRLILYFFLQ